MDRLIIKGELVEQKMNKNHGLLLERVRRIFAVSFKLFTREIQASFKNAIKMRAWSSILQKKVPSSLQ